MNRGELQLLRGERAIRRVRDVLLVPCLQPASRGELRAHPPAGGPPVRLWDGLWLHAPDPDLCDLMREPFRGVLQASHESEFHYMLACEAPAGDRRAHDRLFDEDGEILAALSYSRLMRSHRHTIQYAARVIDYDDGSREVARMLAGRPEAPARGQGRDWLDQAEAHELARLLAPLARGERLGLPTRISSAHWAHEATLSIGWAELLVPKLIEILAASVWTAGASRSALFDWRIPALAAELGLGQLTRDRCRSILASAQSLAHHARVRGVTCDLSRRADWATHGAEITLLEALISRTVHRALADESFRASFDADTALRARWPLKPAA